MLLFLFLFIHVLINCNLYTWQLLHTWPVEKAGNFPFQKGKKEILKNFPKYKSIVYNKLLIDLKLFLKSISRLLWYIFLFLTEHNPSFTLLLICFYFFYPIRASMFLSSVFLHKKMYIFFHNKPDYMKLGLRWPKT